jgi:hypothetical protein
MSKIVSRVLVCSALVAPLAVWPVGSANASKAHVVRITMTRKWRISAPDPRGIAYDNRTHRLLISDSEIDETNQWKGKNLFIESRRGRLRRAGTLAKATVEPEDIAWSDRKRQLFVVDDDQDRVFRFSRGRDGRIGTRDDVVTTVLRTGRFGAADPEGLGICPPRGMLIVTDSTRNRVYKVRRGRDHRFGTRDDRVSSFSTKRLGFRFPTDVTWDKTSGHLFMVSPVKNTILETTLKGRLVRRISLLGTTIKSASGLTFAPGTDGRRHHLYIVDAGIDDSVNPGQNDGRVFELAFRRA